MDSASGSDVVVDAKNYKEYKWDHRVHLCGRPIKDPLLHLCESCSLPVLIYGRMVNILLFVCTLTIWWVWCCRNAVGMLSVVIVLKSREGCVQNAKKEIRRLKRPLWDRSISVFMEEAGLKLACCKDKEKLN